MKNKFYLAIGLFTLLILGSCSKEDINNNSDITMPADSTITTYKTVKISVNGDGMSRAINIGNTNYCWKGYVFQSESEVGKNDWSEYKYHSVQNNTEGVFMTNLPVSEKRGFLSKTEYKFQYKIVFLATNNKNEDENMLPKDFNDILSKEKLAEAITNKFSDNDEIFRSVVSVESNNANVFDNLDLIYPSSTTLTRKSGKFRLVLTKDGFSEDFRSNVRAELTIGELYRQMYLEPKTMSGDSENFEVNLYGKNDYQYTKNENINITTGDQNIEMTALPNFIGISCTIKLYYGDKKEPFLNMSFGSDKGVKIKPNQVSTVKLTQNGFDFNINLDNDNWDGIQ